MRRLALIVAVTLALVGCAPTMATTTNSGEPTRTAMFSRYDRIEGQTDVSSLVFIRNNYFNATSVELSLAAIHSGRDLTAKLDHILWVFNTSSGTGDGWRFLRDHDLTLLLNGHERLAFKGTHEGDVGNILLKESVAFAIPIEQMSRIGSAKTVEGRVGNWAFSLKPEEIAKVREMALFAAMDPNAPKPTRGRDRS